ncbi:MAG: hypothetical protein ACR2HV_07160 [Acidimicrobiales bacterium]
MATARFVLRYGGEGAKPGADVARLRQVVDTVIDDSSPRMLLVASEEEPLRAVMESLPEWVMAPEQAFIVPDTQKKVEGPPARRSPRGSDGPPP